MGRRNEGRIVVELRFFSYRAIRDGGEKIFPTFLIGSFLDSVIRRTLDTRDGLNV